MRDTHELLNGDKDNQHSKEIQQANIHVLSSINKVTSQYSKRRKARAGTHVLSSAERGASQHGESR
jgi:hypothetical protein